MANIPIDARTYQRETVLHGLREEPAVARDRSSCNRNVSGTQRGVSELESNVHRARIKDDDTGHAGCIVDECRRDEWQATRGWRCVVDDRRTYGLVVGNRRRKSWARCGNAHGARPRVA